MPNEWHEHIYAPYKKNESNDYKKWTWNDQDDEQNENVWKCMVRVEKKVYNPDQSLMGLK